MIFADFFRDDKGLVPTCGDRSVVILDGRERLESQLQCAAEHGKQYGYKSFVLMRGESFSRSRAISPIQVI